jgi:membrane-associated phospholipid phosphatase
MTLRLPGLVRRSPTGLAYFAYWAPYVAAYQILNRWPPSVPRELPFTWLDRLVPFVPALLPVYVAYLPLYWWTVFRSANDREVNQIFYAAHVQLLLSLPFFAFMPVRMPVERFYGANPFGWADALWRWFDVPNNCFPSLHVSNCLLLLHMNWPRPLRWPHAVASLAVIASTMLVKQHYAVDVLGGAAVYIASRWFLERLEVTGLDAGGRIVGRHGRTSSASSAPSPIGPRRR